MTNNPSKKLYSDDIINMLKHIKSIGDLPDNISWHSTVQRQFLLYSQPKF